MRIIGLTGTIGAGKSTVAQWLAERGARTIDADRLAHRLYDTDETVRAQVRARFGEGVFVDRRVHRPALAAAVFGRPDLLAALEAIVHPAVHRLEEELIAQARRDGAPVCVIEAIKLVESGGAARCDELWVVVAAERAQLARLAARGLEEREARRRLSHQGNVAGWTSTFLAESDRLGRPRPVIVFDNSGTIEDSRAQAGRLWHGIESQLPSSPGRGFG